MALSLSPDLFDRKCHNRFFHGNLYAFSDREFIFYIYEAKNALLFLF